ncbi:hypothetical protein WH52_09565 [Tenacibaculum holothuriorum]|uniref:Uncharacterized protein n=1 Tax=Tenacibaculum holothuriorum TaxID=1635173 RepID=A0A1Y2PB24_9FLAO|nr:hypothetical protein [Tenacibaculum holothuriorum]OSY87674.1 hypothetical protein WH52_09565 [Tenacibaculum holothuriorum]
MIEVVFKTLIFKTKHIEVNRFIKEITENNSETSYNEVKESLLKLVLYKFIKIKDKSNKGLYINKENNFFKARELGSVNKWLEQQRLINQA